MSDKRTILCGCFSMCFCYLWGIAIISVLIHAVKTNFAFKGTNAPVFTQIVNEWTVQPFVSIIAVKLDISNTTQCPDDHPDEVINETWLGQNVGCDCMMKKNGMKFQRFKQTFTYRPDYANH